MGTQGPDKHGVVAVLEDGEGRLLFIRRGWKLARAPGVWCLVGGEVEAGETFEEAVVREVREEVGLDVAALEKVHESLSPTGEFRLHWLRTRPLRPGQEVRPDAIEVAEARWLRPAEALQLEPMLPALKAWLAAECSRG